MDAAETPAITVRIPSSEIRRVLAENILLELDALNAAPSDETRLNLLRELVKDVRRLASRTLTDAPDNATNEAAQ